MWGRAGGWARAGAALAALLCAWLAVLCAPQAALAQLAVPVLSAQAMDTTGTLTQAQLRALRDKLAQFERQAGTQVVVLMVPTTAGEDIAAYANRVASAWKIGRKDVGDGLLVVVAKDDRRVRVEVARALEAAVTDLGSRQIIDRVVVPRFREGDFAGGLDAGLDALFALVRHEELPLPGVTPGQREPPDWSHMATVFGIGIGLFSLVAAQKQGRWKGIAWGLGLSVPAMLAYFVGWIATGSLEGAQTYFVFCSFATIFVVSLIINALHPGKAGTPGAQQGVAGGSFASGASGSDWSSDSGRSGGYSSGGGGSFGGGGSSGSW